MGSLGSAAFQAIANDSFGEGLVVRVKMRDSANSLVTIEDGAGGGKEKVLSISPFVRKRERRFGIVEAPTMTVRFTHEKLSFNPTSPDFVEPTDRSLVFLWAAVEIGFPEADEWVKVINGKIVRSYVDANGVAELSIRDTAFDVVKGKLPRDRAWTQTGWVSEIQPKIAQTSTSTVTQNQVLTAGGTAWLGDLEYECVVTTGGTSATMIFDLLHVDEPTYNQTGLAAAALQQVLRFGVLACVDIPASVWSGTYSVGDRFTFYTSPVYTASSLNPVPVLQNLLLTGDGGVGTQKNVATGLNISRVTDGPESTWVGMVSRFAGTVVEGAFAKDTPVVELVQGLLAIMQASVFSLGDGRIGVYHFHPDDAGASTAEVTGDPNDARASIIEAKRVEDASDRSSRVTFAYKQFGSGITVGKTRGIAASYEIEDAAADNELVSTTIDYSTPWEVTPSLVESAANQTLARSKEPIGKFLVKGNLYELLAHDLSEFLFVTEPGLSETQTKVSVVEIALDVFRNTVEILGFTDPTVETAYARINRTYVGDADYVY